MIVFKNGGVYVQKQRRSPQGGGRFNSSKTTCISRNKKAFLIGLICASFALILGASLLILKILPKLNGVEEPGRSYTLTISPSEGGYAMYIRNGGTASKVTSSIYANGWENESTTSLTAYPNSGYQFVKWVYKNTTYTTASIYYNGGGISLYFEKTALIVTTISNDSTQGGVSGTGEVTKGQSTTITATPNRGYAFDCWKNSNGEVISTKASYTFTPTEDITLTAYFKVAYVTIHKGDATISDFIQVYDDTNLTLKIVISPNAGEYVSEISFDNSVFYAIESWKAELYGACADALSVTYSVTSGTNKFGMFFDYVYATPSIDIYVRTTNQAYTSLKKPTAGGVSSVAVTATLGGTVTLVGDDYESLTESDTIICSATPCIQGYTFAGWYLSGDMAKPISTSLSVRLAKSTIYGQELIAKFEKISTSNNINSETNNTTDIL